MGAQAAQEARLALLELGVRQPDAGDHADELGKRLGKERERHEREHEIFGVEVPVYEAGALRVADALGALDPRLAPLLLGDGLAVAETQRFPLQHADAVDALADALEEKRQQVGGIGRRGGDQVEVGGDALVEGRAVEPLLVAEVVVEHPLVHRGGPRDRVDARPGEALGDELAAGRAENALAGADRISARSNHLDTRTMDEVSVWLLAVSSARRDFEEPGDREAGERPPGWPAGGRPGGAGRPARRQLSAWWPGPCASRSSRASSSSRRVRSAWRRIATPGCPCDPGS